MDKNININGEKNKIETVETEIFDYKRIFYDNPKESIKKDTSEERKQTHSDKINNKEIKEKRIKKEKKYIATFLIQSAVCLVIIGSIIVAKYTSPKTFVSVSSALNGLYENNITLSDLNKLIDEKILQNETLAAFFNMSGD